MRSLIFTLLMLLTGPLWAASCLETARAINHDLRPRLDAAELAEVLTSLNRSGQLPGKFVTKRQANAGGWKPGSDLWETQPGKSIGGDRFGNRERALPAGQYQEADLDYKGGKRGAKRIVFSRERRFVTIDHYQTFREVPACQ